jgi:hypothetical protein
MEYAPRVQLVETSPFGLRSGRHRLTSPNSSVSVTLFPMVHVGEAEFFEKTYDDAFAHDVVLLEGIKSPVGTHLTRTYRWIRPSRLGLVIQPKYPGPEACRAVLIRADLSQEEFHAEWRKVSPWLRLYVYLLVPLMGLYFRWFASRESIGEHLSLEDYQSREETLSWNPGTVAFNHSLLGARDVRLVEHLREQIDLSGSTERCVAVVYGAAHMRAVLAELGRRGFRSVDSEWRTIIGF